MFQKSTNVYAVSESKATKMKGSQLLDPTHHTFAAVKVVALEEKKSLRSDHPNSKRIGDPRNSSHVVVQGARSAAAHSGDDGDRRLVRRGVALCVRHQRNVQNQRFGSCVSILRWKENKSGSVG
ncbi:hypothetical protein RJT34_25143 [Clitoria ternatea]|uniref:Uncharacterized protein n=1 Tax=Clitoria ternatea TaxID=43366 RepID=A0AAN9FS08_CLITE